MVYENVTEIIGNTPVVKINDRELKGQLFAKLEYLNPGGSTKDRAALYMIQGLIDRGVVNSNTVLVEPTSGNTGIGMAMVAAALNLKCKIIMPDNMSVERIKMMKAYGAEVVLTPGREGMTGAIVKSKEFANLPNHIVLFQFCNPDNVLSHRMTTAQEIIKDFRTLDYVVAGIGTGGTLTGIAEVVKSKYKEIKVIGIEPEGSPVLTKGKKGEHKIQGIGPGFTPIILNLDLVDEVRTVSDDDAIEFARRLSVKHGVLAGFSGGAAYKIAYDIAKTAEVGQKILFIVPDNGERYFSTSLYEV
ncbi:MAG: cysteine synthase A [Epulopiscium sp. Nele67-Bin001]|nr:MAG: cysteine synthase A [Epulopiscium sp. Nele67-Bin001]